MLNYGMPCSLEQEILEKMQQEPSSSGVIEHLGLIDFILFGHIKNGLEPEMGSGVRLCVGKVLSTPRHPLRKGYLPSRVPLHLLSIDCWFQLCTNVPISVMQYTKNGKCDLTSFGFA